METLALDWRRHSPHRGALGSSLGRRRDGSQEAEQRGGGKRLILLLRFS